jgi:protoporphyrinogen oxidase
MSEKKIVIIGAGPTGLGAAYRLQELGYKNFKILERNAYIGGLSASFSKDGFTYDIGGHVIFSHYKYFDTLLDKLLEDEFTVIQRKADVWMQDRFLPYPFQNNIRYLSMEAILECLNGLVDIEGEKGDNLRKNAVTFEQWVLATFGAGIAKYFMLPYNYKVWAHYPKDMNKEWISDRVSIIDLKKVLSNVVLQKEDSNWGPNNVFKFPLYGGTGGLFHKFSKYIKDHLYLNIEVKKINPKTKTLYLTNGETENYDILINTIPLDILVKNLADAPENIVNDTKKLLHNGVYAVGIGLKQPTEHKDKCWVYFPENNCPYYRLTFLSNYSPKLTPEPKENHSCLLMETSYSTYKKEDKNTVINTTIKGLLNTKILKDEKDIISSALYDADYAYPIPSLERDKAVDNILPYLEQNNIYSRGRFGQWKYEAGNMDHSVMQGVEIINFLLKGEKETVRFFK